MRRPLLLTELPSLPLGPDRAWRDAPAFVRRPRHQIDTLAKAFVLPCDREPGQGVNMLQDVIPDERRPRLREVGPDAEEEVLLPAAHLSVMEQHLDGAPCVGAINERRHLSHHAKDDQVCIRAWVGLAPGAL